MATRKRISQATFDDVVRENVEEFEMEKEAALAEAVAQFEKQGVDLTNIDTTGGIGRQELMDSLLILQSIARNTGQEKEKVALLKALGDLQAMCSKQNAYYKRNIMVIEDEGGMNAFLFHLDPEEHPQVLLKTAQVLIDLCNQHELLRDLFEPGGTSKVVRVLEHLLAAASLDGDITTAMLLLVKTVSRTENIKNALSKSALGDILTMLIVTTCKPDEHAAVIEKACRCIRGLCTFDDFRAEMSCAHDNAKFFLKQPQLIATLVQFASTFRSQPELASASFSAIRSMSNTNEAVQFICQQGVIDLLIASLRDVHTVQLPVHFARAVISLIRNIAADDGKKDQLVGQGVVALLVPMLVTEPFSADATLVEHVFGSFAQMTLRSPSNSQRIVHHSGAVELIVAAMRRFPDREALQRQACLTVRNIAGRCPELHPLLLDAGVENVLRDAGKLPTVVDEAYSALRDLGCDVQYVKVSEDGSIMPAFEQFGANKKMNFRAVYDDAPDIEERVAQEARAPFAVPTMDDHDHRHEHGDHCCDDH